MIKFWDVPEACVETEPEAQRYADSLPLRVQKFCFWMWWYCEMAVLGYDQYQRWDIRVMGESDCSSLTYWCLWKAGYLARPDGNLYSYTLFTGTIRRDLMAAGWTVKTPDGNPQDGYVLLNDGHHVAVWIGNGLLAQSSIDERGKATGGQSGDQTGRETNTRSYYSYPWNCYLVPPADPDPAPPRTTPRPTGKEDGGIAGPIYRLYNPNTGEHLWTQGVNEYQVLGHEGWDQEGVSCVAGATGDRVYRMYNPYAVGMGAHHYTSDLNEAQHLWDAGWDFEGVAWRSGGKVKVYRLYNQYVGCHFYSANKDEVLILLEQGWTFEGIGWYAESAS